MTAPYIQLYNAGRSRGDGMTDRHITLGNTTYSGDLVPEYISVQLADGTIVTERTDQSPQHDPLERHQKLMGEIVGHIERLRLTPQCKQTCATHNCIRHCGRIYGHPDDSVACICGGCASAMAGVGA